MEERHKCISNIMNENLMEKGHKKSNQNRFICSICLNRKASQEETRSIECCKRKSKSCPICQRSCEPDDNKSLAKNRYKVDEEISKNEKSLRTSSEINKYVNGKNTCIQTSQPDFAQGLTLLNEVLTVFQTKKQLDLKKDNGSKTIIFKDASVEANITRKPKLSISKTFLYSLEQNDPIQQNGKFTIINCQPETTKASQYSIDLIKHKSSSIPQMKLEELKSSLKEKTKSKDAIEEVNRMFATVRKNELRESLDDSNRPMIRHGPRVLPVVKTNTHNSDNGNKKHDVNNCRHCENSYYMSSGDSFSKHGCCHRDRCEECCQCCLHNPHRCLTPQLYGHCCNTIKEFKERVDAHNENIR